ncbi:MAG: hypothetical protein ACO4A4_07085 [Ilumatobacteraceae bacterium]
MTALDDALATMHEQLWDDARGMVRLYGLHLVRETALGAFLDLEAGNVSRAERALREVLKQQYPPDADPRWAGTFKTHANQPDAGTIDAEGRTRTEQWRDYDPNWRQFLGVILWLTERLYGHVLHEDLRAEMQRAVVAAAAGEHVGRIAPEYSNVALMHSWLADVTGQSTGLVAPVSGQLDRDGDLAEYNSPTYDAISLFAACLLADFSPSPDGRQLGIDVIDRVCSRLQNVWHPKFAMQAGPHSRSYGLDPKLYVSLMSVLMTAIGVPAAGPTTLNDETTHVHDVYFLPLFRRLCGRVRRNFTPQVVDTARRHVQTFGDIRATSLVEPGVIVGFEHGRRGRFALDQYAPFTFMSSYGFLGVRTRPDTEWVDVFEVAPHVYRVETARRAGSDTLQTTAALTIVASRAPITHANELLFGEMSLQFPGIAVEVRLPR